MDLGFWGAGDKCIGLRGSAEDGVGRVDFGMSWPKGNCHVDDFYRGCTSGGDSRSHEGKVGRWYRHARDVASLDVHD